MSAHASSYRAPNIAPTAAPEIPRDQLPTSSLMNSNTDPVFLDVHATQGQGMVDTYHGQATQGRLTSHQWPASASISTTVAETFVSDSQIPSPVYYYRDASGQSFAIMNQTAIPQYRSSAPTVAPIARHPDPVATSLTYHQLDDNTYDQGWGESSTYTSASSSLEVGTSNYGGGSIQGEGSSAYYGHPAENTWDGFQESQHQF
ncbi:hypothetical protein EDD18DRAFT_648077 [Armillaria luteobubalina]|uniref:Uncharacterized protein n=1 Tax=Armillaria luteobubalina TaxID=153913 RepID=A0AA39UQ43_9AGAR|nr:hypothetical protein EDD18DRAFT_648077 [Armillaria luteobubalina]